MSKPAGHARISVTLPPELLEVADRLAGRLDRSRSWVIAEALRRWQAQASAEPIEPEPPVGGSPEEAVLASEAAARAGAGPLPGPAVSVLAFRSVASWRAWLAERGRA